MQKYLEGINIPMYIRPIKLKAMAKEETKIWFDFKDKKAKRAAQKYAFDNNTSVQAMITTALKAMYPKIKIK